MSMTIAISTTSISSAAMRIQKPARGALAANGAAGAGDAASAVAVAPADATENAALSPALVPAGSPAVAAALIVGIGPGEAEALAAGGCSSAGASTPAARRARIARMKV
jgi:hypothetical protein